MTEEVKKQMPTWKAFAISIPTAIVAGYAAVGLLSMTLGGLIGLGIAGGAVAGVLYVANKEVFMAKTSSVYNTLKEAFGISLTLGRKKAAEIGSKLDKTLTENAPKQEAAPTTLTGTSGKDFNAAGAKVEEKAATVATPAAKIDVKP